MGWIWVSNPMGDIRRVNPMGGIWPTGAHRGPQESQKATCGTRGLVNPRGPNGPQEHPRDAKGPKGAP